jgi:2-polyprenyl-3-methyl-5-hydroxy-6-metoxy-1,4-benzoquinol methylase
MENAFDDIYRSSEGFYYGAPSKALVEYAGTLNLAGLEALDLGSGDGRNSFWLGSKGVHVTAVDSSNVAISKLRSRLSSSPEITGLVNPKLADVRDLEIPQGRFEVILAATLLCHLPNAHARELLDRLKQSLGPRGFLYVSVFTTEDPSYSEALSPSASETAAAVINHFRPNQLLHSLLPLRVLRYFEGVEIDRNHGPEHAHGVARAVACRMMN